MSHQKYRQWFGIKGILSGFASAGTSGIVQWLKMPHGKPKRFKMWIEGENSLAPEVAQLLPKLILELALVEDVAGPVASECSEDPYIAELAGRLRGPVAWELRKAHIKVSKAELARICNVAGSETFVIRRLNEGVLNGDILVDDFKHLPFYSTYREYFEQTPELVARAMDIALAAAAFDRASRRNFKKGSK